MSEILNTAPLAVDPTAHRLSPEEAFDHFLQFVLSTGAELYPAQEEAILEIMQGNSVILNTPTGSGKSLVATAHHFFALTQGRTSVYTAPIKALVSEKFFALCKLFGPQQVGMMTGDASINPSAPILCCTAEVLSQMALRFGDEARVHDVIMDEFHYYSDRDRGSAWQIPLLALPRCRFLLMSATLGDVSSIQQDLQTRSGRTVALVQSEQRPVPLEFSYKESFLHETIADLLGRGRAPIYVVSFTQREATELGQDLTSANIANKDARDGIRKELSGFRFDSPFGPSLRRFVSAGIGVHHAGLLPKYRLLVERLAQAGLLQVISGTDTLGVGINVPIRSVVFSKLCKFDGEQVAILSVRDFKQIAGRAGRKGFDERGWVVCQAPEHVVENRKREAKAYGSGKKIKIHKAQPPEKGYVPWDEKIFLRLVNGRPEAMRSRFKLDHGALMNVLQRRNANGYRELVRLIAVCHENEGGKKRLRRHLKSLFQSLEAAGIVQRTRDERTMLPTVELVRGLQSDFSMHQALSLFLLDALERFERLGLPSEEYAMSVLSLIESLQDNPFSILNAQAHKARRALVAQMKGEGAEYEEIREATEKVTFPKPLAEEIYTLFNAFAEQNPWVGRENVHPKSIMREMWEGYFSFAEYVRLYGIETAEGLLLRYLSSSYKMLVRSVPIAFLNDELVEVIGYFRAMIERVDSSLVREWEEMVADGPDTDTDRADAPPPRDISRDPRAFAARIRAELASLVKALSARDYEEAIACLFTDIHDPWSPARLEQAIAPFFEEYDWLRSDHASRMPEHTTLKLVAPKVWEVRHNLLDPQSDLIWFAELVVDLREGTPNEGPLIRLREIRC